MKKPELLSPAGNMECLQAAVLAGCDAVYLGGYTFGARSYAGNFSDEEIIEAVSYCHLRKVKVYVTVNTLVHEDKFDMCISYIDFLHKNNVDAIIVQDLGLMDYVRKVYPNLEIHASTQMHIHNREGVLFAEELGLKRAVVARETSIEQLALMKKKSSIELEVFVHGALCVSYSGQCLMSSMIGGRSGNLGTCSQCCRMKYSLLSDGVKQNKNEYLLSTKDLNTIESIGKLMDIGIDSLKIEGRMKRKEYVYMVTKLYRKAIDNYALYHDTKVTEQDLEQLALLFNRKFTKGFLFNEKNEQIIHNFRPNHMGLPLGKVSDVQNKMISIKLERNLNLLDGIRVIQDTEDYGCTVTKMFINHKSVECAKKGDIVELYLDSRVALDSLVVKTTDSKQLKKIENKLREERQFDISGYACIQIGKPISFTVTDGELTTTSVSSTVVEEAKNSPTTKERVIEQFSKFGGTIYRMNEIDVDMIDENVFIPISLLNELRREVTVKLDNHRLYEIPYVKETYNISIPEYSRTKSMAILIQNEKEYSEVANKNFDTIYTENPELYTEIKNDNVVLKLPRVINYFYEYKIPLLVGEVGSLYRYKDIPLVTDFSLNVVNSYTVAFLHSLGVQKVTLSYELFKNEIKDIIDAYLERYHKHPNIEVIVSSYPEVMISKFNLPKYFGCREHENYLKDSFGNLFRIQSEEDFMRIYHYERIEDSDYESYYKMGVNSLRIHRSL